MHNINQHIFTKEDIQFFIDLVTSSLKRVTSLFKQINGSVALLRDSISKLDGFYQQFVDLRREEPVHPFSNYTYLSLYEAETNGSIRNNKLYGLHLEEKNNVDLKYNLLSKIYIDGEEVSIDDSNLKSFLRTGPLTIKGDVATLDYETSINSLFDSNPATSLEIWVTLPSFYNNKHIRMEKPATFLLTFDLLSSKYVGDIELYLERGFLQSVYYITNGNAKRKADIMFTDSHFVIDIEDETRYINFEISS